MSSTTPGGVFRGQNRPSFPLAKSPARPGGEPLHGRPLWVVESEAGRGSVPPFFPTFCFFVTSSCAQGRIYP